MWLPWLGSVLPDSTLPDSTLAGERPDTSKALRKVGCRVAGGSAPLGWSAATAADRAALPAAGGSGLGPPVRWMSSCKGPDV